MSLDFGLTDEQRRFRSEVEQFFRNADVKLELEAIRASKGETDPRRLYRKMGERGLLAANWPYEYGGLDRTAIEAAIVVEEMALNNVPDILHSLSIQTVGTLILTAADSGQKDRFLPPMARGETFACVLYTEREAGSDLRALKTRANRTGDGDYAICGQKMYSLKANLADYGLCLARTTENNSKYDVFTLFMIPLGSDGVKIARVASSFDEDFFTVDLDGVRVGRGDIVGAVNGGWPLLMKALSFERTGIDYYCRARRWYEWVTRCLVTTGRSSDHALLLELARLGSRLDASRFLAYRVMNQVGVGSVNEALAAISKWYSSELACEIAWWALDILGPDLYLRGCGEYEFLRSGLEAAYREAPALKISGGTSEMMLEALSRLALEAEGFGRGESEL